jgi:hypothetical protein
MSLFRSENNEKSEKKTSQHWAEPVNWDAPMMSSQEKATLFFDELTHFSSDQISKINNYKNSLEQAGALEALHELFEKEQEGLAILKEWRSDLPFFIDGIGPKTLAFLNKEISLLRGKDQQRLKDIHKKFTLWLSKNKAILTPLQESINLWKQNELSKSSSRHETLFLDSPYFNYLIVNADAFSAENFVSETKKAYHQLTVDDFVELIDFAFSTAIPNTPVFLYIQPRKSRETFAYQESQKNDNSQKFFTSDEFLAGLVEGRAKQKGVEVHVLRNKDDILQTFGSNPKSIQSSNIFIFDDATYSGFQKTSLYRETGEISRSRSNNEIRSFEKILPLFQKKMQYFFVGMAKPAIQMFREHNLKFHYQRYLPSVSETMREPHLTLLRQIWHVYGSSPTYIDKHTEADNPLDIEENSLNKPAVVTPFKTPDYVSMESFWKISLESKTALFTLNDENSDRSAESAYIHPDDLLAGYEES